MPTILLAAVLATLPHTPAPLADPTATPQESAPAIDLAPATGEISLTGLEKIANAIADEDRLRVFSVVRERLASLDGELDSATAATVRAELALASLGLEDRGYEAEWREFLGGATVPESAHELRAHLAWLRRDVAGLFPLSDWQVVGPFDNERGRGMRRQTPGEANPAGGPFDGKGAAGDIDWKTALAPGNDGIVYLGWIIHPDVQALALARTFVRATETTEAVLLVGMGEELRVWWNGTPVYEALGGHDFGADGHAIGVTLQPGWNELVLKVGGQDGSPAFSARLVDAENGAPLGLETSAEIPGGVTVQPLEDPGRRIVDSKAVPAPGAHAFLEGRTDPASTLARALLDARAQRVPRKDRPGRADAAQAARALPGSLAATLADLETMTVAGALDIEEDVNPWLAALRSALDRHGDRLRFLHQYAKHARNSQELTDRALEFADRAVAAAPSSILARVRRARALNDAGLSVLARREIDAVVDRPEVLEQPLLANELAYWFAPSDERRKKFLEAAAGKGIESAVDELDRIEQIESNTIDIASIRAEVESSLAEDPYELSILLWAGRKLLAMGHVDESLAMFDRIESASPDWPDANAWHARALMAAGDDAAAIDLLEKVLEFESGSSDEARLIELLTSRMNEGADGVVVTADAPFQARFDEPLEEIVSRHPARAAGDGDAPREVLLSRHVVEAGPDGTSRTYRRIVERVLNDAGVRELDRRGFRAYPGAEEVRVLSARVLRADGTIERARTGRTGGRGYFNLDLPPLEPGDVVDLEWRRDDLQPSIFGNYFGLDAPFTPDTRLPVRESEVVVLAEPGVDLQVDLAGDDIAATEESTVLADGTTELRWRATDIRPRRRESLEPPAIETQPRVRATTYADWDAFGRWWWNLIREEIKTSDEMRAKVVELTKGKETPLEKLRAIYDFVVTDIRYNAWEFGVHGYQPYSAPVIFSRRFGDCKDKAILMKAMLEEVGIEAWPVVIRAEGRRFEEDHALAMIGHFNHCIAYVPEQEGIPAMFLDGTARSHPLEVLPDSDRGAKVVIVSEEGVEVARVPFPDASENVNRETTTIDLRGDDGPKVTLEQRPSGRWDPRQRSIFGGDEASRDEAVERVLTSRFGALLGEPSAEHPDYEDLTSSVTTTLVGSPERIGREVNGGLELPTSHDPLDLLQSVATESERDTDLLLDVPWTQERTLVYELPEGTRERRLPEQVSVDTEDLRFERDVTWESADTGPRVVVRERFTFKTHRVPAERYDAFRKAARKIDEAQRATVDVEVVQ